jgi:hypothetical protein
MNPLVYRIIRRREWFYASRDRPCWAILKAGVMSDGLLFLLLIGGYFVLMRWILPRLGVPT